MKQTFILAIIALAAVATWTRPNLQAQAAPAQAPAQAPAAGRGAAPQGVSPIEKVAGNVYWVRGAGGNSVIFVRSNGVVIVDTKLPNNGQALLDQIRTVTDKPVTHIINTHVHGDHTSGNPFFPQAVEIITHANTATNMRKLELFQQPANAHGLPDRTFTDRLTLGSGEDTVELYYFGQAQTDGDAYIYIPSARVLASGDAFSNTAQPNIDLANGGSAVAYPDTMSKLATIPNVDIVVGGHAPALMKGSDIGDYAEFMRLMVAKARASVAAGKTPEQTMTEFQAEIPAKFRSYGLGPNRGGPGGTFVTIFEELRR